MANMMYFNHDFAWLIAILCCLSSLNKVSFHLAASFTFYHQIDRHKLKCL